MLGTTRISAQTSPASSAVGIRIYLDIRPKVSGTISVSPNSSWKRSDALRASCDRLPARWSEHRRTRNTTAVSSSTVTSYEGGLKSEFFDHRLLFDIAGYHISWEDIQVGVVINGIGALVNAAKPPPMV